jgi:ABC-type transport system substrate-binding protein
LLDRFGYKVPKSGGYRTMPDGHPLVLTMSTTPDSTSRQYDELWKKDLDAIGVHVTFITQKWSELNKMASMGKLQMWSVGMSVPNPDADILYTMLYSGSIGEFNYARFRLPDYDHAYEASARLPNGPERFALFREMDTLVEAYAPMILNAFRYKNLLVQPWLKGFKENIFVTDNWAYYAVDRP